jgi:putative spermidine/putrescine transport system substrate-binding protein
MALTGTPKTGTTRRLQIGRRGILQAGLAAATLGMPAIARAKADHLVVASSGGPMDDTFEAVYYQPFKAKTGISIVKAPNQYAKLRAMVESQAIEWDVMQLAHDQAALFARQNLVEPLDWSMIDKTGLLPGATDPHYVFVDIAAGVVCWNTKRVSGGAVPQSWSEVWDLKRFSGDRMFWKKASETLEVALMADGVPPDKLYPLDVPRALKSLEKLKSHVSWWDTGAQSAQLLIDGEAASGLAWNGRLLGPKLSGAPVDFHFNQALFIADAWIIPRGAKNKRESMEFIAFTLEVDNQANFAKRMPYGPVRTAAMEQLDPARQAIMPTAPENFAKGVVMNANWWAENGTSAVEQFNNWMLA